MLQLSTQRTTITLSPNQLLGIVRLEPFFQHATANTQWLIGIRLVVPEIVLFFEDEVKNCDAKGNQKL